MESPSPSSLRLLTSKIVTADPSSGVLNTLENKTIHVSASTGRILSIEDSSEDDLHFSDAIDLRGKTVLPGFIDTHVHFFLHPYKEASWDEQVTQESTVERTVRAVVHAKNTLLAGYTSVRDLGTEGAEDADVSLRKCISEPSRLIPGPRYFCASRAIVATGSYGPKNIQRPYVTEVDGKSGADPASGVAQCVEVVRRHIGAGADWIKIYADYPARALSMASPRIASRSVPLFSKEEVTAMVEAAHRLQVKVAAHCINPSTIKMLVEAGVDTLEHGAAMDDDALESLVDSHVVWNPTFAAYYSYRYPGSRAWDSLHKVFLHAVNKGVLIGTGGDTGVFPHGDNALEMKLMHRLGMTWDEVIRAATWVAWRSIRPMYWDSKEGQDELEHYRTSRWHDQRLGDNEVAVGCLFPGFAADIIATDGDLVNDFATAVSPESISFVMKAGVVYKRNKVPCC